MATNERSVGEISDQVLERLRASKQRLERERSEEGFSAGMEWAKNCAEADELARLVAYLENCGGENPIWSDEIGLFSPSQQMAFIVRPEIDNDRNAAEHFVKSAFGEKQAYKVEEEEKQGPFVKGFCEGARKVWDNVRDRL